jgi:hypothetical protein
MCKVFLPILHATSPTHQSTIWDAKKCGRRCCASTMGCKRDMMFGDRLRTSTGKSVNQAAVRLNVTRRTVVYQKLSNMWNTYQFRRKYKVYIHDIKSETKLWRFTLKWIVHVCPVVFNVTTLQGLSLHTDFAFDVLWSDYYNHSVVRLELEHHHLAVLTHRYFFVFQESKLEKRINPPWKRNFLSLDSRQSNMQHDVYRTILKVTLLPRKEYILNISN